MEETRNGVDRISKLPDSLIHRIMFFTDTKYTVQTCVLSKRWINIWKSMPSLIFRRSSFSEDKQNSFIMFVDMVLIFRHQEIDIKCFSLDWRNSAFDDSVSTHVNRWILNAVKYNVQNLVIIISQFHNSAYEIPHHLLNCKSLKHLGIVMFGNARYVDIILPCSLSLPQLEELRLVGLSISNAESFKSLFSSCPVLENLGISNCDIQTDNQRNLIVDSVSLKNFIYTCQLRYPLPQNVTKANSIKLCARNLEDFTFTSLFMHDYCLENYSPLSRVSLNIKLTEKKVDENAKTYSKLPSEEKLVYAKRMMKFLAAVAKVKNLTLSSGFLEVMSHALDISDCRPTRLCNLQCLKLDMWFTRGCFRSIAYLLSISPYLTSISLTSMESNLPDVEENWEAGLSMPTEMLSHLEFVRIEEVEGGVNELKFLCFLLKNATVLKKVVLYPRSAVDLPDRVRDQFQEKLRALPRASSRIIMHWPATKSTHLI